jgi:alpha-D-ribose 1-methylphosphonate 5-triphosphate synthase subunit PhnH
MGAVPALGLQDPVHDAQQAFRAALEALSRPGQVQLLGRPIQGLSLGPALSHLLLALTDEDTPVWWQSPRPGLADWLRLHTGARTAAEPGDAAFAVITDASPWPALDAFASGTPQAPERSCTLLVEVPSLQDGPAVPAHGPGIRAACMLRPAGLPADFWPRWQANHAAFPCGVDVFLTCRARVLGLPRTTRVGGLREVACT